MRSAIPLLLSAVIFSTVGLSSFAATPMSATSPIPQANNQFAVDLYGQLAAEQPGKNLFFSPASLSIALAMTAAGAKGQTAAEMAQTLHLADLLPQAHSAYHQSLERWNSKRPDRGYQLRVANRLWGQKGFPFLREYLALTREQYSAPLGLVDFIDATEAARQEINAWVEKQTANKIRELLAKGVVDKLTRLVLTNAVYFKGDWASQFDKAATRDEDFTISAAEKVKIPSMYHKHSYPLAEDDSAQALELPYKGEDLAMLVLLPKAVDGLANLEKSLSAAKIADWQSRLHSQEVNVYLPKFKLESAFSLKTTLEALGMKLPFTDNADFSGMDGRSDLKISAVIHKAFVDVNEQGTEAAAATAVVMTMKSAFPSEPKIFRADHPFVFAICDKHDGTILFLGRVTNPKGS